MDLAVRKFHPIIVNYWLTTDVKVIRLCVGLCNHIALLYLMLSRIVCFVK